MRCAKCGCYTCKCRWHVDQTCEEYQTDPLGHNSKSEKAKRRQCKRCPARGCGNYIKKTGGCPEMMCRKLTSIEFYALLPRFGFLKANTRKRLRDTILL